MFRRLRSKLATLYTALFVLILCLLSAAIYMATTQNVEHVARRQLADTGAVLKTLEGMRHARIRDEAATLLEDPQFRSTLSKSNEDLAPALSAVAQRFKFDLAFIVSDDGRVIGLAKPNITTLPSFVEEKVRAGRSGVFPLDGRLYDAVTVPFQHGRLKGHAVFAIALQPSMLARLDQISAMPLRAAYVLRSQAGWTTLFGGARVIGDTVQRDLDGMKGEEEVQRVGRDSGAALVLLHGLPSLSPDHEVALVIACPIADALEPYAPLAATVLVIGLIGVLLFVGGSWMVASNLTHPIARLDRAVRRLQSGEPDRVELTSDDEIARLGASFNAMADHIAEREAGLKQARDAAEAANQAKNIFLANMNHEVRTPLNGVVGVADMLVHTQLDPRQREMVELIASSGVALQRVLNDVLDMVDLCSNGVELAKRDFDLKSMIVNLAEDARARAEAKGLRFTLMTPSDSTIWIKGDATRIEQILLHLLDNAIKFTETGDVVLRMTTPAVPGELFGFDIVDTGPGFDPRQAEEIFVPFNQADGSLTRKAGGAGLGLSLARSLARTMGGDILAQSGPGQGAVFRVTLDLPIIAPPANEGCELLVAAADDEADAAFRPVRVLMAEDNPANRKVIELILTAVNVELVSVENGLEAVEVFKQEAFDVVLMDLQMPVMDGLTAIRHIREHEAATNAGHTPILVISANVQSNHLKASAEAGADNHLGKPILAQKLIEALEDALMTREESLVTAA